MSTEKRKAALKLEKFVKQNKLSKFNNKATKQKKFERNAALLRGYKKSLKQEGFDDSINTRKKKRGRGEGGVVVDEEKSIIRDRNCKVDDVNDNSDENVGDTSKRRKKVKKSDPLYEAKKKAEEAKRKREEDRAQYENNMKEKEMKLKKRKVKSKKMQQRTRKGQPVMKNMIVSMLEKLQKDNKV